MTIRRGGQQTCHRRARAGDGRPRARRHVGAGPSLFAAAAGLDRDAPRPLADRLRPTAARRGGRAGSSARARRRAHAHAARRRSLGSLIFWGPPGTGKTTVARLLADATELHFEQISAIFSGVADLKKVFEAARGAARDRQGTLLFVDEIHRFNRAQQDSLPAGDGGRHHRAGRRHHREPVVRAQRARCCRARACWCSASLDAAAIEKLLARAEAIEGRPLPLDDEARAALVRMADGDGRAALTLAEEVWRAAARGESLRCRASCRRSCSGARRSTTRAQDSHYNLISALHKSVRGSDPDAALYYLCAHARCRRGPALSRAPAWCAWRSRISASPTRRRWSSATPPRTPTTSSARPEGELAIAQALHLSRDRAEIERRLHGLWRAPAQPPGRRGSLLPPKHILNAPTKLMKSEGYGADYAYDHDAPEAFSGQDYLPEALGRQQLLRRRPTAASSARSGSGQWWEKLRQQRSQQT